MDDPKNAVTDELEGRLDDLSATLTDDDIETTSGESSAWASADADADDTDSDDADQDADADDAGV